MSPTRFSTPLPDVPYSSTTYAVKAAPATRILEDGDMIDLGDRTFEVIHTPGHSPGGIALWEAASGVLISGDLVYDGPLIEDTYHADAEAYIRSMQRLARLPVRVVHGGHFPSFSGARLTDIITHLVERKGPLMDHKTFYIGGAFVAPLTARDFAVENPATEEIVTQISLGTAADVDRAVAAAKAAFPGWAATPLSERRACVERLLEIYKTRYEEMAQAITTEMGAPISMSRAQQADTGVGHVEGFLEALETMEWEWQLPNGDTLMREPIGVVGLITPVELADEPDRFESHPGAFDRLHLCAQTLRDRASVGHALRRDDP